MLSKQLGVFIALFTIVLHTIGQTTTNPFTATGTFAVPSGVTSINVECWGAGGAGGGSTANTSRGGGGGAGGAYANKVVTVIPTNNYTVTVGGVTTGTTAAGANGSPSWFGTVGTVYAQGGAGGLAPNGGTVAGGTGSSASSIGTTVHAGGSGAAGTTARGGAGGGGAGSTGNGGDAAGTTSGTGTSINGGNGGAGIITESNGSNGSVYGGGGGGAYIPDFTNHSGGNGAAGYVLISYTRPTVTISSAVTNPTNNSPFAITITFSEALTVGSFTNVDLTLVNCTASAVATADNITFTSNITPTANGTVSVTVNANAVSNVAGNTNLTASNTLSTVFDNVAPTVITYNPLDNANSVGVNDNLVLTFNENVQAGTAGNFVIYNAVGTIFETISYNDARISYVTNTVTINPTGTFNGNAGYYVLIDNTAIRDMAGNPYTGISTTTTWNFTVPLPYFRSQATGNWNANATWQTSPDNVTWSAATFTPTDLNSASIVISAGNTVTVTASVSVSMLTVNGTLTINAFQTFTVTSAINCGAGTINGNASSSFVVNGIPATNLPPGTYQNLTINRNFGITLCGNTTVNGTLTLNNGDFNVGGNTLTLNGPTIAGSPGNLMTGATSSLVFGGSSTSVLLPFNVATLSNLTINNSNGVSLGGPLSIVGVLTMATGNLNTTASNLLTISNPATGGITSASASSFVNGPLARTLLNNVSANGTTYNFPVGDGTNYKPFDLVDIQTGAISPVVQITESSSGATTEDGTTMSVIASRNWHMQTLSGNFTNAFVRLTDSGIDFTKNVGQSTTQSGPYTSVGGTNIGASITSGQAVTSNSYFAIGTATVKTYYTYQSGDWKSSSTWTRDPSGSFWINAGVPTALDNVVILNGRTVTIFENGKTSATLEIRLGGTLDIATYNGHNFGTVSGQGLMKLSSNSFPGGNFTGFVAAGAGIVEYYDLDNSGISNTQLTYNNLIISNYSNATHTVFLDNTTNPINYTLNGNFNLKNVSTGSLTFSFGNSTPSDNLINLTVNGNFTVDAGCNVRVNNFATSHTLPNPTNSTTAFPVHTLSIYGDLTNNGSVRFTGLPSPVNNAYYILGVTRSGVTNYGDVQVYFKGNTDNTITCNGITDFFRLIVEKGVDQTNILEVISSSTNNFALYAPNNQGSNTFDGGTDGYGWGAYYKALFIHYGTLKLNTNITIPSLTEGGQDFNLIPTACLWLNGANVTTTITGVNGTGYQAATLYGKLRLTAGSLSTGDAAGIVLGTLGTPVMLIEGTGTLDASQVWVASGGTNLMSYTQTGGTANFRMQGEQQNGPMLGLNSTNTVFTMSGGSLNFTNNQFINTVYNYQIMDIQAQQGNYQVTGGTVNLNLPGSATTYTANSTVPFYDLNIFRNGGAATTSVQWNTPGPDLTVLNDLTVGANSVLNLNTSAINLVVGHNFNLPTGATYTPGNNTTTFNGSGGQVFTNAGTITTGLNNFILSNASNTNISNNLIARGALTISSSCFLNDLGSSVSVGGNVTNNGTHTSQANGSIILNGAGAQTIGGSGAGIFGNFSLSKATGTAVFTANQSINGNLRLGTGILNIGIYNLKLSATSNIYDVLVGTPVPTTFGNAKMITTSGQQSDGGLTKSFSATGSFLFPLGTGATYHSGTIAFTQAPASWGDVTIKPVALVHPFVTTGNTGAMKYYWKVISSGITGIQPGSVSHTYQYASPADIVGLENNYVTGLYNPYTWTAGATAQVDKIAKKLNFPLIDDLDGDYTGGVPGAFGVITVYYSRTNGNWNAPTTWSIDPVLKHNGAAAVTTPTSDDAVVIGDGVGINHIVKVTANGAVSGGLQINYGSTIDLQTFTGHNFGALPDLKISGSGTMRISSAVGVAAFPSGDFGNFLGPNGGTVEYYTQTTPALVPASVAFKLPTQYTAGVAVNIVTYANLVLSPANGMNITLPNTDLTIFKDLNINTSGTSSAGVTQLNNTGNSRTVTINGNLNVNKGNLQYTNGGSLAQNVVVNGNVTVANGASFDVAALLSATNTLTINGDLTNNGIFDMIAGATQICNVTFTGSANNVINGTTATRTDFNILTVNKGLDRNSILETTVNAFSLNTALPAALTLTNGTFRLSTPLTITLTTNSPFTIPISGCLSANIGTINIGTLFNAGDLVLQGRLEVLNSGTVNIGTAGTGFNNDIEYAAAGNPEINVSGGTLNVNGQIRRNTSNTLGSLWFNQSGGSIIVRGKNLNNTRGVFEILNSGSKFNVSGGSLTIENAGSLSYDVYLDPEFSNVNGNNGGHTLVIGDGSTPVNQTFNINSSSPLWNLTLDGTTNNKNAILQVNNLSVLNNLTINSNGAGGSIFQANDLDVTIGGSLFNNNRSAVAGINAGGYQASSSAVTNTQTTIFTGIGQILGFAGNLTNFANLVIGSPGTTPAINLGTNSNLRINHDLTLTSGTLSDAGNTITVLGDIANAAKHTSPAAPGGGIVLTNSVKQIISGNGSGHFGNLTINNGTEVRMVDDTWITGQLNLSGGSLYIDDYLLSMDVSSSFAGTFDMNHMVMSNGVMSDKGVQKLFSGSVSNFTVPIGTTGKYRPATYSVTSSTSGVIKVVPVAQAHPADLAPTNDQLNYYWITTVSGFSGLTSSTQVYEYGGAEVTGNENNYHGVLYSGAVWTDFGTGVINPVTHTLTVTRSDLLGGEYTAGELANFVNKPALYSVGSGNWSNGANWSVNSSGIPAYGSAPDGNPVYIQSGHVILMDVNSAYTFSVDLAGTLDLASTAFHNLGYITDTTHVGTGLLRLQATVPGIFLFPGGNYDRFMASPHTTVELYGSNNATMPLKPGNIYKPYQNLVLSETGIKYMSAENLKVLGNLTISNTSQLNNTLFNKNLYIVGDWNDLNTTPASGGFVPGTGTVTFEGSATQTLNVTTGGVTENFYNFQMVNPAGLTLAGGGNVKITNYLTLQTGTITTNTTNSLTLTNSSTSAVIGGSVNSFVNGPLLKQINAGSFFTFPVGKNGTPSRYGNVYLTTVAGAGLWEAEYYNGDPSSNVPPLDGTSTLLPIDQVSSNEYWRVNGATAGSSANVTLRWDSNSGYAGTSAATRSKIRLVEWNGTKWVYRGKVLNDGGPNSGTVTTDASISLSSASSPHWLTIGNEGLPTANITSPLTASLCNDGVATTTVTVALTGAAPWKLTYKLGTVTTTLSNIASSPVSIILTSNSPGITQPIAVNTDFDFNITNVNDANGIAGISDYLTAMVLTVKPIPDNTINGKVLVGTGEVVSYTTPSDASTYAWTLSSNGAPLTGNAATFTVTWGVGTPGPYTISLTKTSAGGCTVTNSKPVTTSTTPTPVISGNQYVCAGSTGNVYSTPNVAGHSYAWAIVPGTAGTITAGTGTSSITVTWNGAASGNSITLDEGSPSIHTVATPLPVDIGIQPSASSPSYTYPASVCNGNTAAITIIGSQTGVRYQLRKNSDNSNVGAAVNGTGGTIILTSTSITTNIVYNIYAYTLAPFNCSTQLTNPASTFSVTALSVLNYGTLAAGDQTICSGNTPANIAFGTAPTGGTGSFNYQWYSYTGLAGACPSGTSVPGGWNLIGGATTNNYTPPSLGASMSYAVMVTPAGSPSCGTATWASGCRQITVTPIPSATISYTGSPFCSNAGMITVNHTGTSGGTYSAAPAGLTLNGATGSITTTTSVPGSYTVTYTIAAAGGCGVVTTNTAAAIKQEGAWAGTTDSDWNKTTNWDCGIIPSLTTDVLIANGKPNYPTLSTGAVGKSNNLTIQNSSSLTVSGNKLQVAGTIANNGTFTAATGIIEMIGSTPQTIPSSTFAGNNLQDLIISNSMGVTLGGPLNLTGILTAVSGNLASNGNLKLISSTIQTALIDGSGAKQVTGNVTMQRYLSSGYGYKYVSSPFSGATVNEFATEINLGATFPTFYSYDENNSIDGLGATFTTGWVKYVTTTNPLVPLAGYAANYGTGGTPVTNEVTGVVNNGPLSVVLYNNNRPYTQGFNLVGNPYPSPIDWDYAPATGWTRNNIDMAIWLFNASNSDEYGGVYSSYVNGVYTDLSLNTTVTPNIIPSMQGFFVHVTDPGSGTLGMTNEVRTSDLNPTYKAATFDPRTILRFTAGYDLKNSVKDAFVLYFDPLSTTNFDSKKDALKLMNTDLTVPNLYSITPDVHQLSINSMPSPVDSITRIPLGIKTLQDGWVIFSAQDVTKLSDDLNLYLLDKEERGAIQNLRINPVYRFYLSKGEYDQRFMLLFAKASGISSPIQPDKLFVITQIDGSVIAVVNLPENELGKLYVSNILGQVIMEETVTNMQLVNISAGINSGVYIVTMTTGVRKQSEKTLIMKK